ncbi:hypothetical protein ACTJJ0_11280 [Chitinophaga sp. 22321]|uniref:hypothetical protein n=1 Tax=Chitinophaga sp. 22321 TaxID=3453909 RepID=UPI003F85FBD7
MKKIKLSVFAVLAILVTVAAVAITKANTSSKVRPLVEQDWQYTPDPSNPSPLLPSNYSPSTIPSTCDGIATVCGIKANADANGDPILTDQMKSDIQNHTKLTNKVFFQR